MMRFLLGFVAGLALGSLAEGQTIPNENLSERTFAEGGTVRLRLSSGDYAVRGTQNDRIVVQWRANDAAHERDVKKIKVYIDVSGQVATVRTDGPTKHAHVTIDVPVHSDLHLRMRAGDVRIDGVEGNKDIRMTAGDLDIAIAPFSYSRVHGSVTIGDLRADPLGISKDGFWRSLDWMGSGKYTLHASLFAGDLKFSHGRPVR